VDAVTARNVTKTYRVGVGRARVREMLPKPLDGAVRGLFPNWWAKDTFNALDNVSFSIPTGSALGMVGHNGAGKTTLLKLIAGVTSPSSGLVTSSGRVGALIDLMVGFHPELTGRENVYLVGSIYGLGRRAMETRIERILDFAEIHEYADTPVKRYSSGMGARLGFATITAIDFDILLVDEVLAVGDASFQRKCIGWLEDFQNSGGTLLFVSHNLGLVRSMTERVLWLDHGALVDDGPTPEVLAKYAKAMERRDSPAHIHSRRDARKQMKSRGLHRYGAGGARVEEVNVDEPSSGQSDLKVAITYESTELEKAVFCVGFLDESGKEVGAAASPPIRVAQHKGAVECWIRPVPFRSGIYFPVVAILSPDGRIRDRWRLDRAIVVDKDGQGGLADAFGPVEIPSVWSDG
jgi:ABC-type polysaccharide/polyol phosphate transport system ATPase subunit